MVYVRLVPLAISYAANVLPAAGMLQKIGVSIKKFFHNDDMRYLLRTVKG
jgi:hypothetical protein